MRTMLRSKIYNIKVTDASIHYDGSITIDSKLMHFADIVPYEQVHVLDVTNGKRFITYAIEGKDDEICVNGAAALLVNIGDEIIVLAYSLYAYDGRDFQPRIVNGQTAKSATY